MKLLIELLIFVISNITPKTASLTPLEKWKTVLTDIHNSHIAIGHLNKEILKVNIEGMEFDLLNFRDYRRLPLVDSPFGRGTETLVDKKVRNSREYTLKNYVDKALQILGQTVVNNVLGNGFCTIPYKVIVYEKESFFSGHVDTPEDDLLYTLILVLPSKHKGGDLVFGERFNTTEKMVEPTKFINFVLFRINCPHRVEKVTDGYRASITFKVYKSEENLVHYFEDRPILSDKILPALDESNILLAYPNIDQISDLLIKSGIDFILAYGAVRENIKTVYSEVREDDDEDNCNGHYCGEEVKLKRFSLIKRGDRYSINKVINIGFETSFVQLGGETGNEGYEAVFQVPYVKFILINPEKSSGYQGYYSSESD